MPPAGTGAMSFAGASPPSRPAPRLRERRIASGLQEGDPRMRRHRLAACASALLMAGGLAILGMPGSASAATCYGASCAGHDPAVYSCSASRTVSAAAQLNGTTLATVEN